MIIIIFSLTFLALIELVISLILIKSHLIFNHFAILKYIFYFPQFKNSCKINILEKSELLQQIQKANIKDTKIKWLNNLNELSNFPSIFIANEFFDALPIKQFLKKKKNGMKDVLILVMIKS